MSSSRLLTSASRKHQSSAKGCLRVYGAEAHLGPGAPDDVYLVFKLDHNSRSTTWARRIPPGGMHTWGTGLTRGVVAAQAPSASQPVAEWLLGRDTPPFAEALRVYVFAAPQVAPGPDSSGGAAKLGGSSVSEEDRALGFVEVPLVALKTSNKKTALAGGPFVLFGRGGRSVSLSLDLLASWENADASRADFILEGTGTLARKTDELCTMLDALCGELEPDLPMNSRREPQASHPVRTRANSARAEQAKLRGGVYRRDLAEPMPSRAAREDVQRAHRASPAVASGGQGRVQHAERGPFVPSAFPSGPAEARSPVPQSNASYCVTIIGVRDLQLRAPPPGLYCICEISGCTRSKFRTPVCCGSLEVVWNYDAELNGHKSGDTLVFSIHRVGVRDGESLVGRAVLDSEQLSLTREFEEDLPVFEASASAGGEVGDAILRIKVRPAPLRGVQGDVSTREDRDIGRRSLSPLSSRRPVTNAETGSEVSRFLREHRHLRKAPALHSRFEEWLKSPTDMLVR